MNVRMCGLAAALGLVLAATAEAQQLQPMEPGMAQAYAKHLADEFAKVKDTPVKVDVDASKAVGLVDGREGIIIVPVKGLKEGEVDKEVYLDRGAGLAYLFLSPRFNPVINGKVIPADKLRTVKYDDEGEEKEATCLLLSVRNVDGDDWRLYGYGAGQKPLVDTRFIEAEGGSEGDLTVSVKDAKDGKQTLVVTLFGKYSAEFAIGG